MSAWEEYGIETDVKAFVAKLGEEIHSREDWDRVVYGQAKRFHNAEERIAKGDMTPDEAFDALLGVTTSMGLMNMAIDRKYYTPPELVDNVIALGKLPKPLFEAMAADMPHELRFIAMEGLNKIARHVKHLEE